MPLGRLSSRSMWPQMSVDPTNKLVAVEPDEPPLPPGVDPARKQQKTSGPRFVAERIQGGNPIPIDDATALEKLEKFYRSPDKFPQGVEYTITSYPYAGSASAPDKETKNTYLVTRDAAGRYSQKNISSAAGRVLEVKLRLE